MTREEIKEKVIFIIEEQMGLTRDKITEEKMFVNDFGADSLDCVELIMEFEDQFDLSITDEDAEKVVTVKDAINYVEEKVE